MCYNFSQVGAGNRDTDSILFSALHAAEDGTFRMKTGEKMRRVMFLCTANSCRSQMAEGLAREFGKEVIEVYSAGLMAAGVHPRAVSVMKEIGIDISRQKSKEIDDKILGSMDVVITLCGHAEKHCPRTPPGIARIHWPVEDPVGTIGTEERIMYEFRRARDEIREKIMNFIKGLHDSGKTA